MKKILITVGLFLATFSLLAQNTKKSDDVCYNPNLVKDTSKNKCTINNSNRYF